MRGQGGQSNLLRFKLQADGQSGIGRTQNVESGAGDFRPDTVAGKHENLHVSTRYPMVLLRIKVP